jgi:bifunctional UDP-N-acetylglucosamine pyrophosphorylase/glucosamine-1-phosphate N-acetyltransferase
LSNNKCRDLVRIGFAGQGYDLFEPTQGGTRVHKLVAVVLAAGKGTRMKSALPKVLHRVCGRFMVEHVIQAARVAGAARVVVVIGYKADMVSRSLGDAVDYAYQKEQLGTGHAVMTAMSAVEPEEDLVMVLCGDTPLITAATLHRLQEHHCASGAAVTILTARYENPSGYGRIIRSADGTVQGIVEDKDATPAQRETKEINTGIYCFNKEVLLSALSAIGADNVQGEYYLTDCIAAIKETNGKVETVTGSEEETLGINSRVQLAEAEGVLRRRVLEELMLSGVTIIDPATTFVDQGVTIRPDTVIYPFTVLEGSTSIGGNCAIGPGTRIVSSKIGDRTVIQNSVILNSQVGEKCNIGPFAYLRPETVLADGVKVGDFVEIKKSTLGPGSKVPHLSYVGDTTIGQEVNIGAGTITCNYDGIKKSVTVIEDHAFVGSNTNLVAPVRVGKKAVIGAGSTITQDIPAGALAIARSRQRNIEGWVRRKRDAADPEPDLLEKNQHKD